MYVQKKLINTECQKTVFQRIIKMATRQFQTPSGDVVVGGEPHAKSAKFWKKAAGF